MREDGKGRGAESPRCAGNHSFFFPSFLSVHAYVCLRPSSPLSVTLLKHLFFSRGSIKPTLQEPRLLSSYPQETSPISSVISCGEKGTHLRRRVKYTESDFQPKRDLRYP